MTTSTLQVQFPPHYELLPSQVVATFPDHAPVQLVYACMHASKHTTLQASDLVQALIACKQRSPAASMHPKHHAPSMLRPPAGTAQTLCRAPDQAPHPAQHAPRHPSLCASCHCAHNPHMHSSLGDSIQDQGKGATDSRSVHVTADPVCSGHGGKMPGGMGSGAKLRRQGEALTSSPSVLAAPHAHPCVCLLHTRPSG